MDRGRTRLSPVLLLVCLRPDDMLAVGSENQWRNGRLLKRNLQFAIGIVISAVFIYMALPGLHFQLVLETLQSANYWWLLPGVAVFFVGLWVRTWRWQYMLRPIKPVPILHLFPLVCIGYFGNNVFPFRAGEVLRSYLLKREENISFVSSLTTVLIERIFDGLTMLLFVFLALPFVPAMPPVYRRSGYRAHRSAAGRYRYLHLDGHAPPTDGAVLRVFRRPSVARQVPACR